MGAAFKRRRLIILSTPKESLMEMEQIFSVVPHPILSVTTLKVPSLLLSQ